jgi:prohead serine protease
MTAPKERTMTTDSTIHTKSVALELKDEATGEVEAVVATLNVVDRDREVITTDAIKSGSKVAMSSYGHNIVGFFGSSMPPVGKGKLFIEGEKAVFRGKLFLKTERGRETLEVLKEMGKDQEWSFGFQVLGSEVPDEKWRKQGAMAILTKLDAFEVSPVIRGAGIGTHTVSAKEGDPATPPAEPPPAGDPPATDPPPDPPVDLLAPDPAAAAEAAALEQQRADEAKVAADAQVKAELMEEVQRVQRSLKRLGVL